MKTQVSKLLLLTFLCSVSPYHLFAQGIAQPLKLRIEFSKKEFLLSEPVVANIFLTNGSKVEAEVSKELEAEYGHVVFFVTPPDGRPPFRFKPFVIYDGVDSTLKIPPGKTVHSVAKLFYGSEGYTFGKPGVYLVEAHYRFRKTSASSNKVSLRVVPPEEKVDKAAADLFIGKGQALFLLFENGDHNSDDVRKLGKLIKEYPKSVYAPYAHFALGTSLTKDFVNYAENKVRPASWEGAMTYLLAAKDSLTEPYYLQNTYSAITRGYTTLGNADFAATLGKEYIVRVGKHKNQTPFIEKFIYSLAAATRTIAADDAYKTLTIPRAEEARKVLAVVEASIPPERKLELKNFESLDVLGIYAKGPKGGVAK